MGVTAPSKSQLWMHNTPRSSFYLVTRSSSVNLLIPLSPLIRGCPETVWLCPDLVEISSVSSDPQLASRGGTPRKGKGERNEGRGGGTGRRRGKEGRRKVERTKEEREGRKGREEERERGRQNGHPSF